jgi:hypothetical protein
MLGRLRMSAEECIDSYAALSRHVFHKKHHLSLKINGQLKDRFDASVLEDAIKDIVSSRDVQLDEPQSTESSHLDAMTAARGNPDLLMKDDATGPSCKVYGCAFMGVFLATGLTNHLY